MADVARTADLSFEQLLRSLAAVHEQQEDTIKALTEENAALRARVVYEDVMDGSKNALRQADDACSVEPIFSLDAEAEAALESYNQETGRPQTATPTAEVPEVWPEWAGPTKERIQKSSLPASPLQVVDDRTGETMVVSAGYLDHFVVKPHSLIRLAWDLTTSVMVCYDVISIPLMVFLANSDAIGNSEHQFMSTMDWVTTCFWTLDIPRSFLSGYHGQGIVEMRPSAVAKHYLKTWFIFDFLIIVVDWSILYAHHIGREADALGVVRFGKTVRVARILRTVRLWRFVRLQRLVRELIDMINSEAVRALFNVILAVAFIVTINHYLACGWYYVGSIALAEDLPNWIQVSGVDCQSNQIACYMTALHWSLTQFTPASMEIRPYNLMERVYSICTLLFALVAFSSFLGSITASITKLRQHNSETEKHVHTLRVYFSKNKVSTELSREIWSFLRHHHFNHRTRSHTDEVPFLALLPARLRGKLALELYSPYLTRAPIFYHYMAINCGGLLELCSQAITEKAVVCHEDLFLAGKAADKMYVIISGKMTYDHPEECFNADLTTGSWASEAVLWVKWVHWGRLFASTSCEILELDSCRFREVIGSFSHSLPFVKRYAYHFAERLHDLGTSGHTDVMQRIYDFENMARRAWCDVTAEKDHADFQPMPLKNFPRWSRSKRVQSLVWEHENHSQWKRVSKLVVPLAALAQRRAGRTFSRG
mmetsp:Transcript_49850/g.115770  ORF Transcript_49850/g.115770 Transcript_49850/m.115770 type:complete len:711 (-) Transcript_49850:82-2214(-)